MTTQYVGDNRLLKLADYLEQLPSNAIRMDAWAQHKTSFGSHYWSSYDSEEAEQGREKFKALSKDGIVELPTSVEEVRSCGFAACAVGWAGTVPSFKRAGFKIVAPEGDRQFSPRFKNATHNVTDGEAVKAFFAIDADALDALFMPDSYRAESPRPATVANKLRKFVAKRQK